MNIEQFTKKEMEKIQQEEIEAKKNAYCEPYAYKEMITRIWEEDGGVSLLMLLNELERKLKEIAEDYEANCNEEIKARVEVGFCNGKCKCKGV